MSDGVAFAVSGRPIPQGSLRAFIRGGKPILTYGHAMTLGAWRQAIAANASDAMGDRPMLTGPVAVALTFVMERPKGHYGARGTVLPRYASPYPIVAPDVDKLVRAVLDALSRIAYRDDSQVVELVAAKQYGDRAGLRVELHALDAEPAA